MIRTQRASTSRLRRRGAVLIMVLVLIPVLAFGAYSFTHWMRAESRAAIVATQQTQARWLADAGIQRTRALLAQPVDDSNPLDLTDNPTEFAAQQLFVDQVGNIGMYTVIAPTDDGTDSVRFGLVDECAKIPLHNPKLKLTSESLMSLDGMTQEIADAILDWIDADDDTRENGAEVDYYLALSSPYQPRNGIPQTLGELLLVKGVTPHLLYGEDLNLDGVINPNENDGDESWPPDNSDGILQRGWLPYLTFHSADANLTPEGEPKINIAGELTPEDETAISEKFGEEFIAFLKAYKEGRQITTLSQLINASTASGGTQGSDGSGDGSGREDGSGQGSGDRSGSGGGRGGGDQTPGGDRQEDGEEGEEGRERNNRNQEREEPVILSPWTTKNMGEYLQSALEQLTVSGEPVRKGVINVNRAPAFVLRALPDVTEEIADQIASAAASRSATETTPAWLLLEEVVDLELFRKIEPFITTQGKVFRVESVGFFENGGPVVRVEAIIDVSTGIPVLVQKRELSAQGNAYPREVLLGIQSY